MYMHTQNLGHFQTPTIVLYITYMEQGFLRITTMHL